jgi:hypothetical protein
LLPSVLLPDGSAADEPFAPPDEPVGAAEPLVVADGCGFVPDRGAVDADVPDDVDGLAVDLPALRFGEADFTFDGRVDCGLPSFDVAALVAVGAITGAGATVLGATIVTLTELASFRLSRQSGSNDTE